MRHRQVGGSRLPPASPLPFSQHCLPLSSLGAKSQQADPHAGPSPRRGPPPTRFPSSRPRKARRALRSPPSRRSGSRGSKQLRSPRQRLRCAAGAGSRGRRCGRAAGLGAAAGRTAGELGPHGSRGQTRRRVSTPRSASGWAAGDPGRRLGPDRDPFSRAGAAVPRVLSPCPARVGAVHSMFGAIRWPDPKVSLKKKTESPIYGRAGNPSKLQDMSVCVTLREPERVDLVVCQFSCLRNGDKDSPCSHEITKYLSVEIEVNPWELLLLRLQARLVESRLAFLALHRCWAFFFFFLQIESKARGSKRIRTGFGALLNLLPRSPNPSRSLPEVCLH